MLLFDFTADSGFGQVVFDAALLAQKLLSPTCRLNDCNLTSWMRIYHVVSSHGFPEVFFNDRVFDPNASLPPGFFGAELSGLIISAVDNMIAWNQGDQLPPVSRIAGTPGVVRDVNGDGTIVDRDVDLVFTQEGGSSFPPTTTLFAPFSNVAQDLIPSFLRVPLVDLDPRVLPSWLLVQNFLGAEPLAIVPP
jgi:hypothetical protein